MKYIITSGCSFSDPNGNPKTWVKNLEELLPSDSFTFIHRGIGCSGNKWISLSLIYEINKLKKRGIASKDIIIIPMWSGIHRVDFVVNENELHNYKKIVYSRDNPPGINNFEKGFITKNNYSDTGLLTSGGFYNGTSKKEHDYYINQYYTEFYTFESGWVNALTHILLLQNLAARENIPILNLSWQSIFEVPLNDDSRCGHSANIEMYNNLSNMNESYPAYSFLYELIDFTTWWLYSSDQIKTGGLGDWANFNNMPLHRSHPTEVAHSKFTKEIIIPELDKRFNLTNN